MSMLITLEKKEFMDAVSRVSRFAERRGSSLPSLAGILLVAGDDGIKLRATNLETSIDFKVSGTIQKAGVVVLPATTLKDITSSFSGTGIITIEHAGDTVLISSPAGRSTLKTLPYEDFPTLPFPDAPQATIPLSGTVIKNLISSVASCASPSSVRPELGSVMISAVGGVLTAVATDSFRLAEKKVIVPETVAPFSILIPAKNALDIIQTIPDEAITVLVDEHQCAFSWPLGIVTTRLVTIAYPDYTQIIPKTFVSEAQVLRKDFEAGARRTAIFSDSFQKIKVQFIKEEKNIAFSARNSDIGESSESIPAAITGDSIELSFNYRYLAAPLSLITSETITLSAAGIGRPMIMKGLGDTSFLYLVMPMNQ